MEQRAPSRALRWGVHSIILLGSAFALLLAQPPLGSPLAILRWFAVTLPVAALVMTALLLASRLRLAKAALWACRWCFLGVAALGWINWRSARWTDVAIWAGVLVVIWLLHGLVAHLSRPGLKDVLDQHVHGDVRAATEDEAVELLR